MRMVPGTDTELVAHRDTFASGDLLSRGQEIMVKVDEARTADLDAAARARHAAIMQRQGEFFYRGTTRLAMSPESDGPPMLSSPLSTREVGA